MKPEIDDPEVRMLASIAGTLKADCVIEGPDDLAFLRGRGACGLA